VNYTRYTAPSSGVFDDEGGETFPRCVDCAQSDEMFEAQACDSGVHLLDKRIVCPDLFLSLVEGNLEADEWPEGLVIRLEPYPSGGWLCVVAYPPEQVVRYRAVGVRTPSLVFRGDDIEDLTMEFYECSQLERMLPFECPPESVVASDFYPVDKIVAQAPAVLGENKSNWAAYGPVPSIGNVRARRAQRLRSGANVVDRQARRRERKREARRERRRSRRDYRDN